VIKNTAEYNKSRSTLYHLYICLYKNWQTEFRGYETRVTIL